MVLCGLPDSDHVQLLWYRHIMLIHIRDLEIQSSPKSALLQPPICGTPRTLSLTLSTQLAMVMAAFEQTPPPPFPGTTFKTVNYGTCCYSVLGVEGLPMSVNNTIDPTSFDARLEAIT